MSENGKISVLMGIYNCADTLEEAVQSIQNQTYSDWELILCDDGSTDNTYEVAARLAGEDSRIILLKNESNKGLNETLNNCLAAASGYYIARMDGDDRCKPERFEKQVAALKENPDYSIVSSAMELFDESGVWGKQVTPEFPTAEQVVTGTPICHAPVLMYKSCMDAVGGYSVDKKKLRVEDIDLWIRLYEAGFRCINIQEPLYEMRNDQNALKRRKYRYRVNSTRVRLAGCKKLHLGLKARIKAFNPMIAGLVPAGLRSRIRKAQNKQKHADQN